MDVEIEFTDGEKRLHYCDDVAFEEEGQVVVLRWFIPAVAELKQGEKLLRGVPTKKLAQSLVYVMRNVRSVLMWEQASVDQHVHLTGKEEEEP